jgi:hypothetical protein
MAGVYIQHKKNHAAGTSPGSLQLCSTALRIHET